MDVIVHRPGGGSNIGTEAAVNANPDGYTLLLVANASAVNATLYEKLNFNFLRDIAPVAGIARVPNVIELHPSIPAKTVPEFIAYAKANPGKISYASAGTGTLLYVAGELPTIGEFLSGFEAASFLGVGRPEPHFSRDHRMLNKEINAGLTDPKMKARLSEPGPVLLGSPADFGRLLVEETAKWGKVVKFAGIKPD